MKKSNVAEVTPAAMPSTVCGGTQLINVVLHDEDFVLAKGETKVAEYNKEYKDDISNMKAELIAAADKAANITWTSSDESVATVDKDGKITAVAPGEADIMITANGGQKTESLDAIYVKVVEK